MAKRFWRGFVAGAAAGAGAAAAAGLLINQIGGAGKRRVVRLEKSIQIGRPVHEVFESWTNLERLPRISDTIQNIRHDGARSHWCLHLNGCVVEWEAEIEQFIPDQAIGWKSVRGPKHTGRITFAPIGNDTLVQVTMNYAPKARVLRPFVGNMSGLLEDMVEQVLRDFKSALEGKGQEGRKPGVRGTPVGPGTEMTQTELSRATGTFGPLGSEKLMSSNEVVDRFGNRTNPVEYTPPPEAKR